MTKRKFDIIVILLIALLLTILSYLNFVDESVKYMFIPLLAIYFIGQYSQRRFIK